MSKFMIGSPFTRSLTNPKKKIAKLMVQMRMKIPIEWRGESSAGGELNKFSLKKSSQSLPCGNLQSLSADRIVRLDGDASKEFPNDDPLPDVAK